MLQQRSYRVDSNNSWSVDHVQTLKKRLLSVGLNQPYKRCDNFLVSWVTGTLFNRYNLNEEKNVFKTFCKRSENLRYSETFS